MKKSGFVRTIVILLTLAILFCITACGFGNSSNSQEQEEELISQTCTGTSGSLEEREEKEVINLTWTENPLAEKVPIPKSTLGYINNNNSSMFEVYLSNFNLDDFNAYVDECIRMGYTLEVNRQDAFFYAQSEDHYEVRLAYEDGDVMHIAISEVDYDVEIKIIHANSSSSKCEVEIEIDGYDEEEIESGDMVAAFSSYLGAGTHELRVVSTRDDDIYGTILFDVTSDCYYEFEINCTNIEIEISVRGKLNNQLSAIDDEVQTESELETGGNNEVEPNFYIAPNPVTPKESIDLAEARSIFEYVFEEYNVLIDDFICLIEYCSENTFTSIDEIHKYENQWIELSNTAYQLANMLLIKTPPEEVEEEWADFADRLMKIGSILFRNSTMDANLDNHYDAAEMEAVINGAREEFVTVSEEIIEIAKRFNSITKGEATTVPDNTTSSNDKKCEECSNEGTHAIIGLTGQVEYYCTKHYNELKEMLEIFG